MNKHFFQILILLSFSLILFGCQATGVKTTESEIPAEPIAPPQNTKLQPILQLDTGGHTSIIEDLIVTSDKKYLISCSTDKTIRVWDMQTKKEVRKILGEIGEGPFGQIFAIALSPDDQYLAVGGFLDSKENRQDASAIRIYHFPSGELRRILKSHEDVVHDLSFSPDGKYLVSGSADKTVKVWDMTDAVKNSPLERGQRGVFYTEQGRSNTPPTPSQEGIFKDTPPAPSQEGIQTEISPVHTFSEHSDDVYAVSIFPHQGDYRVVSAAYDNQVVLYSLKQKEKLTSFLRNDRASSLAVSDKYIASSGPNDREINIFDLNLKPVKTIESETISTGLAFSPDGKLLLAGTGDNPLNCNIYDTQQNFKKIQSFQKNDNLTKAVTFADNSTAITGGGDNFDIWFWNPRTGESKGHITGSGKRVWAVGIKGDEVAFGNIALKQFEYNTGTLEKGFRLTAFTPFQPQDFSAFSIISTQFQDYSLSHTQGGPYGYKEGILLVEKNGETVRRIERDTTNGYRHNCYGFTPSGLILSGGMNGFLKAYNTNGDEIADFIGHTGEVCAIALDGDRLVSGGSDMVIHVWDLKKLREGKRKIKPSFSLFVSNENEWVVWMPEGFFTASPGGRKFIGYHINRGKENAAEYIRVDQLYDLYYRPDLVAKRIQGGFEKEIQDAAARIGNIEEILQSGLPPMLEILDMPAKQVKGRNITLKLKLTDRGGGIGNVVYRVNGVAVGDPEGSRPVDFIGSRSSGVIQKNLTLRHGKNLITVTGYNKQGKIESDPVEFPVEINDPMSEKPDLYALCVGISQYRDRSLALKYAADDALSMRQELENRGSSLFRNVKVNVLTDKEASTDGITAAFKEIASRIRVSDVFVLYLSGHGKTLEANYHFIPWEFAYENEESIRRQAMNQEKIQQLLSMIPALKSLIILDTCYSGSVTLAAKGMEEKTAIDRLMRATGRATLAATSDTAQAYEGYEGHGIFTHALLEGLKGHADFCRGDRNGSTGIDELGKYVREEVPRITYEKFGFEQIPMNSIIGDPFDIGIPEKNIRPECLPYKPSGKLMHGKEPVYNAALLRPRSLHFSTDSRKTGNIILGSLRVE